LKEQKGGTFKLDQNDFKILSVNPGECNYATPPGQMHITRLVHGTRLHVSSSAGWTVRWTPTED